jgi:hypothetical protein
MTPLNPVIFTSFVFSVQSKMTFTVSSRFKYLFLHAADIRATAATLRHLPTPPPPLPLPPSPHSPPPRSATSLTVTDIIYAPDLELSVVIISDFLQASTITPPPSHHRSPPASPPPTRSYSPSTTWESSTTTCADSTAAAKTLTTPTLHG